jgi:ABC transport system ATP-binding/permease protein
VKNPNFLILDEPTNDLDLITLSTLEQFLSEFGGCLIIVSHDRYFMDRLADNLLILEGDGVVKFFNGKYTEYRESLKEQEKEDLRQSRKERAEEKIVKHVEVKKASQLSGKEKQEYNKLEKEMAALEKKKSELTAKLNSGITDHAELFKISSEISSLTEQIESKMLRWMELGEAAG